jgi:hypothetical protein
MTPLDDFIKSEESKMSWVEKAFVGYPKMYSTKELSGSTNGLTSEKQRIIYPSFFVRTIAILFLGFSIVCWFILFNLLIKNVLVPVVIGALIFVSFIIGIIVWNTFFNRTYIYSIKLSNSHLEIDKKIIPWNEISETQIMQHQIGRGRNSYLVIFAKNGQVHKYSLFKFGISDKKLSTLFEFYKAKVDQIA